MIPVHAANPKVNGRRVHPCSPSDIDLIMTPFALVQKPGQNFLLPTTQT